MKSKILFLPGVGSFKKAMNEIKIRKLDKVIHETIKRTLHFRYLLRYAITWNFKQRRWSHKRIKVVNNKIFKFSDKETKNKKIPHVGFNSVKFEKSNKLFRGLESNSDFYFVHSYRMLPEKLKNNISITKYGVNFLSSFNQENVFATQFHQKKSR